MLRTLAIFVLVPFLGLGVAFAERTPAERAKRAHHAFVLSAEGALASVAVTAVGVEMVSHDVDGPAGVVAIAALVTGPASLLVTPSLGQLYATGSVATPGFAVRAGGFGVMLAGSVLYLADNASFCINDGNPCPSTRERGLVVIGVGAAAVLGGALYDIATASSVAEQHDDRESSWRVTPTAFQTSDHHVASGVGITGRF